MDNWCLQQNSFMDQPTVQPLLNPELHTLHCLVDLSICRDSGYVILAALSEMETTMMAKYCPAYRIGGESGFDKTLALARAVGNKKGGCSTCKGSELDRGFRALFVGTVDDDGGGDDLAAFSLGPVELRVTSVLKAGSACPNGMSQTRPPCGIISVRPTTTTTTANATTTTTGNGATTAMAPTTSTRKANASTTTGSAQNTMAAASTTTSV